MDIKTLLIVGAILLGYLLLSWRLLHVSEGMHEDFLYVSAAQSVTPPSVLAVRGLSRWSLWWEAHHGLTPAQMRLWNLRIAVGVACLVGVLAWRLELSAVVAGGVMLLHPLGIETLATMSGRGELIAAVGVVGACVAATFIWPVALLGSAAGLLIGLSGKESAIVGVPLVALCWAMAHPSKLAWIVWMITVIGLIVVAWTHRAADVSFHYQVSPLAWLLVQATAAWRLCVLLIVPLGQTPDFDYDHVPHLWQVGALIGVSLIATIAGLVRHTWPMIAFAVTWILLVILPRLIVQTPKSYFNEHQAFLMIVGMALGVSALCSRRVRVA